MNKTLEIRLAEHAWHGDTTFYELIPLGGALSIDEHDDVKYPEEVVLRIDGNEYAYILKTTEKCKTVSMDCFGNPPYNTSGLHGNIASGHDRKERIVRCKDCKSYLAHEWIAATDVSDICRFWANGIGVRVEPDGFCSWGIRREAEQ